jgi:type II secretory pathway pseudopilin PulG
MDAPYSQFLATRPVGVSRRWVEGSAGGPLDERPTHERARAADTPFVRFYTRSNQSGFALIEVIASAAVLGFVTLAVYGGYNATLHSSGRERARAVAASLAEQDQERLRSFRPTDLATYAAAPRIVKVPAGTGVPYTVTSTVDWISDSADGTSSCTSTANLEDYLRITSTVTSGIVGKQIKAVTQRSLVAPPVGTFRQGLGTMVVRVTGKGTLPITNLPVKIQGPTTNTVNTNAFGCSVFRYVPVGNYAISFNRAGYVDTKGINLSTSSGTVSEGTMNVVSLSYDQGASVLATFDTQYRGTTCTPPACPVSKGMEIMLESSDLPAPMNLPAGANDQSAQLPSVTTPLLYPFDSAYSIYSGGCTDANPQKLAVPYNPAFAKTPGGLNPGQLLYPVTIRQPALNVQVINGSGAANIVNNQHITATPTHGNCAGELRYRLWSYMGTNAADTGNVNRGWASKNASVATGGFDPGLPYGEYDICVDNGSKRSKSTLASLLNVDNYTPGGSAQITVDLSVAANVTTGQTCPW